MVVKHYSKETTVVCPQCGWIGDTKNTEDVEDMGDAYGTRTSPRCRHKNLGTVSEYMGASSAWHDSVNIPSFLRIVYPFLVELK